MKKTRLNQIGKKGRANLGANKILAKRWIDEGIDYCEIGALGEFNERFYKLFSIDCLKNWLLQNVHRHKRDHYNGDQEKLADRNEVVRGCQNCHDKIEVNKKLTEEVFEELRPQ